MRHVVLRENRIKKMLHLLVLLLKIVILLLKLLKLKSDLTGKDRGGGAMC